MLLRLGSVYEIRLLIISKTKYKHRKLGGKFIYFRTQEFLRKRHFNNNNNNINNNNNKLCIENDKIII